MRRSWLINAFISFASGRRRLFVDKFANTAEEVSTETPSAPQPDETSTPGPVRGPEATPSRSSRYEAGRLLVADWTTYPLDASDLVQSYLVDHPDHYYMTPDRSSVYILIRGRGLVMYKQDFRNVPDERVAEFVFYLRRSIE